jgi:hypothetical protein
MQISCGGEHWIHEVQEKEGSGEKRKRTSRMSTLMSRRGPDSGEAGKRILKVLTMVWEKPLRPVQVGAEVEDRALLSGWIEV